MTLFKQLARRMLKWRADQKELREGLGEQGVGGAEITYFNVLTFLKVIFVEVFSISLASFDS